MAKRFTDNTKWKNKWFKRLSTVNKLFFLYILDECDHAGIWRVEIDIAEIRINEKIDINSAIQEFSKHVQVFDNGEKWFMPSFIQYQYGVLKDTVNAHKSVKSLLIQNNLLKKYQQFINSSSTDQDKDKDKDISFNNSKRATAIERILKAYPKVVLHNKALLEIGHAIQREVDKGMSEDETIIMIEDSVKKYSDSLDDVKYAIKACEWFAHGGYLSVESNRKKDIKDNPNQMTEAEAIEIHMKNWEAPKNDK